MAPGKRVIKRIENTTSRHITFAKRRRGLVKKAQELSILCDSSVALLVFSPSGKLFDYSSSNLHMIIQRYLTHIESIQNPSYSDLNNTDNGTDDGEVVQLKRLSLQIERSIRQMNGKDLEDSSLDDLIEIEKNIKKGLNSVKSSKNELVRKQLDDIEQGLAIAKNDNEKLYQGLEFMEEVKKLRSLLNQTKALEEEDVSSEQKHDAYSVNTSKECGNCNEEPHACLCLRLELHLGSR